MAELLDKFGAGRVRLTDHEWMSLIAVDRGGLERCCADVSDLRDQIIALAREDGEVWSITAEIFLEQYDHVAETHDLSSFGTLNLLAGKIREIKAAQDARPQRAQKPEPPRAVLRLEPHEHIHDVVTGEPMPDPCPNGLSCKEFPRLVDVQEEDGKVRSYCRVATRADAVAHGIQEARGVLWLLTGAPRWKVPLYDDVERALAELTAATAIAAPILWPDGA